MRRVVNIALIALSLFLVSDYVCRFIGDKIDIYRDDQPELRVRGFQPWHREFEMHGYDYRRMEEKTAGFLSEFGHSIRYPYVYAFTFSASSHSNRVSQYERPGRAGWNRNEFDLRFLAIRKTKYQSAWRRIKMILFGPCAGDAPDFVLSDNFHFAFFFPEAGGKVGVSEMECRMDEKSGTGQGGVYHEMWLKTLEVPAVFPMKDLLDAASRDGGRGPVAIVSTERVVDRPEIDAGELEELKRRHRHSVFHIHRCDGDGALFLPDIPFSGEGEEGGGS